MSGPETSEKGGRAVRIERYGWYRETDDRPGLPWIGIFLVIFGGLLLLEQLAPELRAAGSLLVLAFGLAFLVSWVANRRMSALYVGAVVTALSLAAALSDLHVISGEGWGTLFLGIAFIGIAAVRAVGGGGLGWQAIFGGLLIVIGGSTVASNLAGVPDASRYVWPVLIVVLGLLLLARGASRRDFRA